MTLANSIELFTNAGVQWLFRYIHVVVGIAWIGLLYYFNFVQMPMMPPKSISSMAGPQ